MEPMTLWVIGFAVASAVLFTLEIIIPSGGLLGMLSMSSLIGMIVCLFLIDTTYGWIGLVASLFIVPSAIAASMKLFPHTPVGKRLILGSGGAKPEVRYSSDDTGNDGLLGREGVVISDLRPVGVCDINGQRVECLSERGTLESGARVKVVSVSGLEIKVRPV